jgi:cysteine desulfurase
MPQIINLDHAAEAPLNKDAKNAIKDLIGSDLYNTDSSYEPAVKLRREIADLKSKIAKLIGAKSPNIFITTGSSNATSILFNAIHQANFNGEFITTNIEHSSLLNEISDFKNKNIIKVGTNGLPDLKTIEQSITKNTLLISVQYVNNETGQVLPIKEISSLIKAERLRRQKSDNPLPIFFHTDASQAAITQDIQVPRLGIDSMSLNGSKFGALPTSGLLYVSSDILRWLDASGVQIKPQKENLLSIISIYHALAHAVEKKNTEAKRLLSLSKAFWSEFQNQLPGVSLNPESLKIGKNHSSHILNIQVPNVSGEKLVILAGMNNILISTGAACSASKDKPSHVLEALELSKDKIQSSIRVSFGSANKSEHEVVDAAKKLAKLCQNSSVRLT